MTNDSILSENESEGGLLNDNINDVRVMNNNTLNSSIFNENISVLNEKVTKVGDVMIFITQEII